jgi:hypothetical protein
MSPTLTARFAQLALLLVPLVVVAGCPFDAASTASVPTGTYWVEYHDSELAAYVLPAARGETGSWVTVPASQAPGWYTGPALYELGGDLTWKRLTTDTSLTLDAVLQTYDAPPVPETPVTEAPAGS